MDTIRIEKLTLDDADLYYDVFDANRSHIAAHDARLGKMFMTIGEVAEKLAPYSTKYNHHFGIMYDNEFVGSAALFERGDQQAEVTYWLDQDYTGRGLARQACRMLINHGRQDLYVTEFDAVIAPQNIASRRTVEGLGFQPVSTFKEDIVYALDLS